MHAWFSLFYYLPAFDAERLAIDYRVGDYTPRILEDPAEGLPGHAHFPGCRFLVQAFEIGQADRFGAV